MAKKDFIQHVLGGCQSFGRLETLVIPADTILLQLKRVGGPGIKAGIRAIPHRTVKDLHVTIRGHFIEEVDWDDVDQEEGSEEEAE